MGASEILSQYGLAGLVIAALVTVVLNRNSRIDKLYEKIEQLYRDKEVFQEKRNSDMLAIIDKQNTLVADFSQTAKLLFDTLKKGDK